MSSMIPIAIRWDSWYSTAVDADQGQHCLSPAKWQSRLPWFSNVQSPFVATSAGSQANMDLEIQLAHQAGIKAFMFDWYQWSDPSLYVGKQLYDASSFNGLVKWCGAPVPVDFVGSGAYQARCNAWVTYFQQSNYLTVLSGRPILFIFDTTSQITTYFTNYAGFKVALDYLRSQCLAATGKQPYIVILGNQFASDTATSATALGADAISKYSPYLTPEIAGPYSDADADVKAYWVSQFATGLKMIPPSLSGWDPRPRFERPESYTHGTVVPYQGNNVYFVPPTATAVANNIQAALTYAGTTQPGACESQAILMYSWNECSEGGRGMIPTIGDPPTNVESGQSLLTSNLLKAVGPVLRAVA